MSPKKQHQIPPEKRFTTPWYRPEACELALSGTAVPQALGDKVTQACVVRGIRSYDGFALDLHGTSPLFTRALNARAIMSDRIPDIDSPDHVPYCIWYPDVASEATYRELAHRYPEMKYAVGRVCAVAGYLDLYRELQLLPEVHIAEEARDNGQYELYNEILSSPVRYSVMDDYHCLATSVEPIFPAYLSGNTGVRSTLGRLRKHSKPFGNPPHSPAWLQTERCYFNITEDYCVGSEDFLPQAVFDAQALTARHLYTLLPPDLPPLDKDLLILIAAYHGDLDRYARLRRPDIFLPKEQTCVIRGIYHNTFYAKWWAQQVSEVDPSGSGYFRIRSAILARQIMDNDLSRVAVETSPLLLPYCIWYPKVPHPSTLEALAILRPDMVHQVARACIVADYESLFDDLSPDPDQPLLAEARASPNLHYLQRLESKFVLVNKGAADTVPMSDGWKMYTIRNANKASTTVLDRVVNAGLVGTDFGWLYGRSAADIGSIELHVSCLGGQIGPRLEPESAAHLALATKGSADLAIEYSNTSQEDDPSKANVAWPASGENADLSI